MTEIEACGSCRYSRPCNEAGRREAFAELECHRRPPVVIPLEGDQEAVAGQAWPQVAREDWCGEWRAVRRDRGEIHVQIDPPGPHDAGPWAVPPPGRYGPAGHRNTGQ